MCCVFETAKGIPFAFENVSAMSFADSEIKDKGAAAAAADVEQPSLELAFLTAAETDDVAAIERLLQRVDPSFVDNNALRLAAAKGHLAVVGG
jgi:hypothetical protein